MPTVFLAPIGNGYNFLNSSGSVPNAAGKIFTYLAGTTTPQATYTTSTGSIANQNPIILDVAGRPIDSGNPVEIWLVTGITYKFVLQDAFGSTIATYDNLSGINDVLGSSSNISFTQTGSGTVPRTIQAKLTEFVSVKDYGALGDGVTDDTAAIQNAVNSGRAIWCPAGTYVTGTINFPNTDGLKFIGEGPSVTVFQSKTTNTVIFQKIASPGVMQQAHIGWFSLKAHSLGSTGPAFKCTGMRHCLMEQIASITSGGSGFLSLFDVSANPYLCYANEWKEITMPGVGGWTKMFDFNDNATGNSANNSNVGRIVNPWAVDNVGMGTIIDGVRSAKIELVGGLFENNSGATAVSPGQAWHIHDCWFEANAADIVMLNPVSGSAAADVMINGNVFSTAHSIDMTNATGVYWFGNTETGKQTWTNNTGGVNFKAKEPKVIPTAPTISYSSGQTGTLASPTNALLGMSQPDRIKFRHTFTWTVVSAGTNTVFALSAAPTNYVLIGITIVASVNATSAPEVTGYDSTLAALFVTNLATTAQTVVVISEYQFAG